MRNENAADIYAEEQMPQEIREKIAALESVGQAKLIPKAQHELKGSIECALDTGKISAGTCAYLKAHYLHEAFLPAQITQRQIILFHGSRDAVGWPSLSKCREANDFGKCFYCTEDMELAKEWSCQCGVGRCRFRLHIKNGWTEHSQPKFRAVPYTQLDWDTAAAPSAEQPGR